MQFTYEVPKSFLQSNIMRNGLHLHIIFAEGIVKYMFMRENVSILTEVKVVFVHWCTIYNK